MKKLAFITLVFSLVFLIPKVFSAQVTSSPSAYTSCGWTNPTYAYSSDDLRAYASPSSSLPNITCIYYNYNFNIPQNAKITKVEVGSEWYTTNPTYENYFVYVSWNAGLNWYILEFLDQSSEALAWKDFTLVTSWTPDKLNNTNFRVKVEATYSVGGGECYRNTTYFVITKNSTCLNYKNLELLNIQDWDFYNPEEILQKLQNNETLYALIWNETSKEFKCSKVKSVDVHEGDWILYDIYSGELNYLDEKLSLEFYYKSHTELTPNHNVFYSLDGKNFILGNAQEVYDLYKQGKTIYINHLWFNYTLAPFPVTAINVSNFTGKVYNVRVENEDLKTFKMGKTLFDNVTLKFKYKNKEYKITGERQFIYFLKSLGVPVGKFPPFLQITKKSTVYLDWLPVRVTYDLPPTYSLNSTNSTLAGSAVLHSLYWQDDYGLSGYIFSFDNCTGSFVNDTWVSFSGLGNWSNVTKVINSTVGCEIRWRVYANDTSNIWNASEIFSYVTTGIGDTQAPQYSLNST
ncbi:MAG: hypothetical protein QXG39_08545, partial [Candidatus Aenigmatarchaeota archaeon]